MSGVVSMILIMMVILIFKQDINRQINIAKELRALDAQKNKFFSIISHDLRNPVNAVKQLSSFLKADKIAEAEVKTIGKMIDESILKVSNLLEDLLKWGRLQMNRIEFSLEIFKVSDLLKETVTTLQNTANIKNITIDMVGDENILINADKNMIQTVFRNLISNAIKFTSKGGLIIIDIHSNNNFAIIDFKDNGIGMSADNVQKLFRIDATYSMKGTDNEQGTGLGLILCKEFLEKNGGKIKVSSILDKGSVFSVSIPLP